MAAKHRKEQPQPIAASEQKTEIKVCGDASTLVGPDFWECDDDLMYRLVVDHWAAQEGTLMTIELTRDEYHALKAHLGKLRGFTVEPEAKAA